MDRIGQQLGDYILLRLLGRGSEADVYLGQHLYDGRLAAIKVLCTCINNDGGERFRREAYILGTLKHPRIVRLLEFHGDARPPFIVLDYIPGGTLRQLCPKGSTLSLEKVVSYVAQLGDALQHIHDLTLIHRDIKPENILLGDQQQLFLSDFGLAVSTSQSCQQEISYMQSVQGVAGTLSYMAPEQLQSHAIQASDQYSLAIMVYELLCGERPFQGALTEILMKQMTVRPPSLRMKNNAIPLGVENVVMKALEKDPEMRFRTVHEFSQALALASRKGLETKYGYNTEALSLKTDDIQLSPETTLLLPKQLNKALAVMNQAEKRARSRTLLDSATTVYSPQDAGDLCGCS
jgi:serine/threonine protein kinase